jgi:hypothetical protein
MREDGMLICRSSTCLTPFELSLFFYVVREADRMPTRAPIMTPVVSFFD